MSLFLHHGASPNATDHDGGSALGLSSTALIAQLLLEKVLHLYQDERDHDAHLRAEQGADSARNGPLFDAIRIGHYRLARLLLKHGAPVNEFNQDGESPLHLCLYDNSIVQLLLDHGADPNLASPIGETPLQRVTSEISCWRGRGTGRTHSWSLSLLWGP